MLFKQEHKKMILNGTKTATRRIWKKPMVKIGGIYKCKTYMLSKRYFAKIEVIRLYKQKLGDMKEEDAKKEGYPSLKEFFKIWWEINGTIHFKQEIYVIEFKLKVKECENCDKKLEGRKGKYCSADCSNKHYYQKNKKRIQKRLKKYFREKLKDLCKCGNKKYVGSKQCQKCHDSNKNRGQLSRLLK